MSGYDFYGLYVTSNGNDVVDTPMEGALRIPRAASVDSTCSGCSESDRSTSLVNFSYGSSSSSHISDNAEASPEAAAQRSTQRSHGPSQVGSTRARRQPDNPKEDSAGNAASRANSQTCDRDGSKENDASKAPDVSAQKWGEDARKASEKEGHIITTGSDASLLGSFTTVSLFRGSDTTPREKSSRKEEKDAKKESTTEDVSVTPQSLQSRATANPPIKLKSILQKESSFRRPALHRASSARKAATGTQGPADVVSPHSASTSATAPTEEPGWKVADDASGFYVPHDIMQNLDFSGVDVPRSAPGRRPTSSRPTGAPPTRSSARGPPSAQRSGRRTSQSARASEPQRRLSMRGPVLSSTEVSHK